MSNCQKCNVHNELSNDKNYSDEVAIWTELDIHDERIEAINLNEENVDE